MTTTYLYIQFKIQDMEAFNEYAERVSETTQIYGGKTIAINKSPTTLHGDLAADVCVIQHWSSLEAARAWHDSPEYAPL